MHRPFLGGINRLYSRGLCRNNYGDSLGHSHLSGRKVFYRSLFARVIVIVAMQGVEQGSIE